MIEPSDPLDRAYCEHLGYHPDSISGRACLRGAYRTAPRFIQFRDELLLRERQEDNPE